MLKDQPLVSVIVTTYNREKKLIRALDSVFDQSYSNFEVIVVDDNSNYDLRKVVGRFDRRIILIQNDQNRGANWSRCAGIARSSGEYLAFLDDDDRWHKNKLETQVKALLDNDPSCIGVTCGYKNHQGNVNIPPKLSESNVEKELLMGENIIGGFSTVMVRSDAIEDAGLPDIHMSSFQDLEWYIRLVQVGYFTSIQRPLVIYSDDPNADRISNRKIENLDNSYSNVLMKHSGKVNSYGYIFYKLTQSIANYKIAEYAIQSENYSMSILYCLYSIKNYPFSKSPYILIIYVAYMFVYSTLVD